MARGLLVARTMSPVRNAFFAVASLSLVSLAVACGGAIDSPLTQSVDPSPPGSSGSSGSSGGASGSVGTCTAAPSCDSGDTRVARESACPQDAPCYNRSLCGQTIWCSGTTYCAGIPYCPVGYVQVASCLSQGTGDCVKETVCGSTILCRRDLSQCDGLPSCNPGETQVASSSQCLQDDAVCYQASACGVSIWCTGPLLPPPPPPKK